MPQGVPALQYRIAYSNEIIHTEQPQSRPIGLWQWSQMPKQHVGFHFRLWQRRALMSEPIPHRVVVPKRIYLLGSGVQLCERTSVEAPAQVWVGTREAQSAAAHAAVLCERTGNTSILSPRAVPSSCCPQLSRALRCIHDMAASTICVSHTNHCVCFLELYRLGL
jgi:hypothetical protein